MLEKVKSEYGNDTPIKIINPIDHNTKEEMNEYLNSEEYESERFDNAIRFCDEDCMDDYSESIFDFEE